ncbi:hypothetical protein NHQ30_007307 [Ciborinia camelliae]|nr:hypothetical protein NHQ30_007307 [Ciborinia camelliae]
MPQRQSENGYRHMPSAESNRRQSRLEDIRGGLHTLFSGRTDVEARSPPPESPKAPRLDGLGNLPSTRIHIPGLTISQSSTRRNSTTTETTLPRHEESPLSPAPRSASRLSQPTPPPVVSSPVSTIPSRVQRRSSRRFLSVDPAEERLNDMENRGRRRRETPRGPHEIHSLISGLFLVLVLTIYLALALSSKGETEEFHVLLILIVMILTVFFCHSLVRLCMMIVKPPTEEEPHSRRLPSMVGPGGYAETSVPIPVALARDEEAAGIESQATKFPPPAYGLWRESVRVDPNRIFWQRNEAALHRTMSRTSEGSSTVNRPPSYMSDDGIDYVIEAAPRSTVPGDDVLPRHPTARHPSH